MGRSGTTLLEKLLCNHNELSVLSQPIPLLFVDIKKRFLNTLGIDKYYVLNDSINNEDYNLEEFIAFLKTFKYKTGEIHRIFEKMTTFSGQLTSVDYSNFDNTERSFLELFLKVNRENAHNINAKYFGSKEILCEEFMPHFIANGIKVLIIVRDPRDVLTSVNYPNSTKFLGEKKPSLFVLRSWRKSIDFIKAYQHNSDLIYLKYEDLILKTEETLNKVTEFLGVGKFPVNHFKDGILNQKGEIWKSNTSSNVNSVKISSQSIGSYKTKLSKSEIAYTEAICYKEMSYFNYKTTITMEDRAEIIKSFKDKDIPVQVELPKNYSSLLENISLEISRFLK